MVQAAVSLVEYPVFNPVSFSTAVTAVPPGGHIRMNAMFARRVLSVSFVLTSFIGVTSIGGCSGGDAKPGAWIEDGTPAAEKQADFVTDLAKEFFVDWLTGHGEKHKPELEDIKPDLFAKNFLEAARFVIENE